MSEERVVYRDLQYKERIKCASCLALVPCTCLCCLPYFYYLMKKGPSGLPDMARLPDHEAKAYLDTLQGGYLVQYQCHC